MQFRDNLNQYPAYDRRMSILQKQGKYSDEMNNHLIPNEIYIQN